MLGETPEELRPGRCVESEAPVPKPHLLKGAVGVTFIARCNHTDVINLRMPHKLGETEKLKKKTHNDGILWPYTHFFLSRAAPSSTATSSKAMDILDRLELLPPRLVSYGGFMEVLWRYPKKSSIFFGRIFFFHHKPMHFGIPPMTSRKPPSALDLTPSLAGYNLISLRWTLHEPVVGPPV